MGKYVIACLFCSFPLMYLNANDTISIHDCLQQAVQNHPLSTGKEYFQQIYDLKLKNIKTGWFPNVDLSGQATYQSDVVEVGLDFSPLINYINSLIPRQTPPSGSPANPPAFNIPSAPKDQYKVLLDINQIIYDGGMVRNGKRMEMASLDANLQEIEVELNNVKENVNRLYFSILLLQKNEELLKIIRANLLEKHKIIRSGVDNGTILTSNLDGLEAELLKTEQQLFELEINLGALLKNLGEITGNHFDKEDIFTMPQVYISDTVINQRPELKMFDYQKNKLDATQDVLKTQRKPKAFVFSQAGYGNPGLNMLNDEFDTYYIVGAGFKWNIYDWNKNNRERQVLEINKRLIENNRDNFNRNLGMAIENNISEIDKYERLLQTDLKIIQKREKISEIYSSQFENGVINTSDYITELNAEKQAKLNYEMHQIQLVQSKINYLNLVGQL